MATYESIRPLLFKMGPERAHDLTIAMLHKLWAPKPREHHHRLAVCVAGIEFPTPIGLAAGFDKNAKAPGRMLGFGFGSVEVGTVTPEPQPGNSSPRVFRLEDDNAIINRFGFNSEGHSVVRRRLMKRHGKPGIVGVNIGANKGSRDWVADYVAGVRVFSSVASYLAINISSPNTPGLRDLQARDQFRELIKAVISERNAGSGPPVFVKISPDVSDQQVKDIAEIAMEERVDALIVGNTTTSRPMSLRSPARTEGGGLSGAPLRKLALGVLKKFRAEVETRVPLIAVGGISSAEDVYESIRAGAALTQLYTAIAYKGPGIATELEEGLLRLLDADGLHSISDAIGLDVRANSSVRASRKKVATQRLQSA